MFSLILALQTFEQTVELLVIWGTVTVMWYTVVANLFDWMHRHWDGNVILMRLSSLTAPRVIRKTTSIAARTNITGTCISFIPVQYHEYRLLSPWIRTSHLAPVARLLTWISKYTHCKLWREITYPFPNFNGAISNFTWQFTRPVIIYPC